MKQAQASRLHILYLPRWYPHRYDPMMGLFIERHGLAVSPHVDISVLYVHADDKLQGKTYEIVHSENGLFTKRIYFKKSTMKPAFLANLVNTWRFAISHFKGIRLIRRERGRENLVHVHVLTRLGVIARLNKMIHGVPYVITEHWTRYLPNMDTYSGTFRKLATQRVVRHAAAVLPVTANLRDAMIDNKLRNSNYVVIPNVVDIQKFAPAESKSPRQRKKMVHLSCFTDKQKNISGILRVMKTLNQQRNDFELTLIGDGEDFDKMHQLADEMHLTDKVVKFAGLKEGQELVELLQQADLMIMFSYFENLPVVILESYACGVPVISTRVGGIHEHLDERLGQLTTAGDEKEFATALNDTLDNPNRYQSQTIRRYAVEHFSNDVIGRSLFEVYQQVARKTK
ncbi:MAG: glycosyltransferase [Bacteroidales bacterium]|jgi:glycosyltransferase involved in cell wall biosynthesis|nr:glycosyltransferase [Bacteroidales bacterium]MDD4740610.1 glycosyltransferase [Bacteroidales bacterium]MDY0335526.1 glycosyltransferase [Bacteroidales bacterium]NCU36579.1 glycosyltransferase family 4 protein [Candidatus Falkowbacteria bacterium]